MAVEFSFRYILFQGITLIFGILLDWYIFRSWKRYVQLRGYAHWYYRITFVLSVAVALMIPLTIWLRQAEPVPSGINQVFHKIIAFWYVPKIPMLMYLLVYDVLVWFKKNNSIKKISSQISAFKKDKSVDSLSQTQPISQAAQQKSRRQFLRHLARSSSLVIPAIPVGILGCEAVFTVYDFKTYHITIPLRTLPRQFDGFTIVQVSDFHAGTLWSEKPVQEMCRIIREQKADMIMITGDWVNFRADELGILLPEISGLCRNKSPQFGVIGCLGNHDHYAHHSDINVIMQGIREAGVDLLVNQQRVISTDGAKIQIAGNDNVGLRQRFGDLQQTLAGLSPEHPTILLAHDPTLWDSQVRGFMPQGISVDIMLSGHTHGGQIGISIAGMELSPASILYKQSAGLYSDEQETKQQYLYVNRGIGTTGIPLRIGIPPEITVITLQKG